MSRKQVLLKMSSLISQDLALFNGVSQSEFSQFFSFFEEGEIVVAVSQYGKFNELIEEKKKGMGKRLDDFLYRKDIVPVIYFFQTWDGDSCEILEEIVSIVKRESAKMTKEKSNKIFSWEFGQCINCHRLASVRQLIEGVNYLCPGCFQTCMFCMTVNCKDEDSPQGDSLL